MPASLNRRAILRAAMRKLERLRSTSRAPRDDDEARRFVEREVKWQIRIQSAEDHDQ